jgi:transforming growth factor-beta-induced protein
MKRRTFLTAALCGTIALGAMAMPARPTLAQGQDIVAVATGAGSFKTLVAAVQAAGLAETLQGEGPFTVFAPTDEAFTKLPAGTIDNLLKPENKDQLVAILTYHVVPGNVKAADVVALPSAKTVNGAEVTITVADGKVKVNDANVVATDIGASNGTIHVIDAVLLPPATVKAPPAQDIVDTAASAGSFKTLVAAVQAAGLANTLKGRGPFTVFAPTDEAFAKLPAGTVEDLLKPENRAKLRSVLLYHVARGNLDSSTLAKHSGVAMQNGMRVQLKPAGRALTINGANVTMPDIKATNGTIHVIDTVLIPPGNIVDTAAGAGSFKTLAAALEAAGLVNTLKGRGPFTVFAPTDEAFAKLPAGTVEDLLKPENRARLRSVLLYHVARGNLDSTAVSKLKSIRTQQGKAVPVTVKDGQVMIGDATVSAADVLSSNGTIHVIDSVLIP